MSGKTYCKHTGGVSARKNAYHENPNIKFASDKATA
jgi:hypothetical protein